MSWVVSGCLPQRTVRTLNTWYQGHTVAYTTEDSRSVRKQLMRSVRDVDLGYEEREGFSEVVKQYRVSRVQRDKPFTNLHMARIMLLAAKQQETLSEECKKLETSLEKTIVFCDIIAASQRLGQYFAKIGRKPREIMVRAINDKAFDSPVQFLPNSNPTVRAIDETFTVVYGGLEGFIRDDRVFQHNFAVLAKNLLKIDLQSSSELDAYLRFELAFQKARTDVILRVFGNIPDVADSIVSSDNHSHTHP